MSDDHVHLLVTAASQIARHPRYRGWYSWNDAITDAHLWAGSHDRTVTEALAEGKPGEARLGRLVARHLMGKAREARAFKAGYHPEDEHSYSKATIEALLPVIWDDDFLQHPPKTGEPADFVKVKSDPAHAGNWLAMVADVKRAWQLTDLSTAERYVLSLAYGDGLAPGQIARSRREDTSDAVLVDLDSGLRRLREFLGGSLGGCPRSCKDCSTGEENQGE